MKSYLKNNNIRRFIRILIALFVTAAVCRYLYPSQLVAMLVSTLFVMFTETGNALYQGMLRYFILIIAVIFANLIGLSENNFYLQLNAVTFCAIIGVVCNVMILPDKINVAFQGKAIPLLRSSTTYFAAIVNLMLTGESDAANKAQWLLEKNLLKLPAWIDEPGFDITLQKGYRYYVMKLNHLAQILFAMHYLARYTYEKELLVSIKSPLMQSVLRMDEFVHAIITLLSLKKLKEGVHDFAEDIDEIERQFKAMISIPIDILQAHKDQQYFAEFIYALSEMRAALIQLAKALRNV